VRKGKDKQCARNRTRF